MRSVEAVSAELYFDWNATSPPAPEVLDAMARASERVWANPSSVHGAGRQARAELENTREVVAQVLGFASRDVVFTASGTEANNLALRSAAALITSRLEHPSVVRVAEQLQREGKPVIWLEVTERGGITPRTVAAALQRVPDPAECVVAVMAANHETGVLQPIQEIGELVRAAGARLHVDAVQLVGKAGLDALASASSVSVSPHKFRGPKGIAALAFRGRPPQPVLVGGAQERGIRPGTADAVAAVGFRMALERARARAASEAARLAPLRARLEASCQQYGTVNGQKPRLAHVSNISFHGFPGPELVAALDLEGVRVSSGSACSAGTSEASAVIEAMAGRQRALEAVRFSMGESTTSESVDRLLGMLRRVLESQA